MNNFVTRTITGATYVALLTASLLFHPWAFYAFFFLVTIGAVFEYYKLMHKHGQEALAVSGIIIALLVYTGSYLSASGASGLTVFLLVIPFVLYVFLRVLFTEDMSATKNIQATFSGIVYAGLPIAILPWMAFGHDTVGFSGTFILCMFILIWTNDTGAYLSGMALGKHPFFPRISPKKTWEGTIGGFLLTIIISFVLSKFLLDIDWPMALLLGSIVSIFATLGDLVESMLKREAGVKDSGNVLPGHGGVLDRFDSLLFVAPTVYLIYSLLS
jgi:phosphatidate cytidylyltransferase